MIFEEQNFVFINALTIKIVTHFMMIKICPKLISPSTLDTIYQKQFLIQHNLAPV